MTYRTPPPERPRQGKIRDPRQIRALASAVRQEIVDTVEALGACSVADLARELGRPADALYYHLRALVRVRLLQAAGERGAGRERETLYATTSPGHGLRLVYDPADAENTAAVVRAVGGMLRATERNFADAYRPRVAVTAGSRRNLWAARVEGWLGEQEVEEANRLLVRLRKLFEGPSPGRGQAAGKPRLHALTFVIAPLEARPPRRPAGNK